MSKYDFKAQNVTIIEQNHGNVQSNFSSNGTSLIAEDLIKNILNTNKEEEFFDFLKQAEPLFENKTRADSQKIVGDIVKQHIDSIEKKKAFIQKIKQFTYNISTSFIGSLILQAVSELNF